MSDACAPRRNSVSHSVDIVGRARMDLVGLLVYACGTMVHVAPLVSILWFPGFSVV